MLCIRTAAPFVGYPSTHLKKNTFLILRSARCNGSNQQTSHSSDHGPHLCLQHQQPVQHRYQNDLTTKGVKLAGMVLLGSLWFLGRPTPPAAAGVVRPSPHLETVVTVAPHAGVAAASVTNESDSCVMLVAVCLGFWMLSATISAGIGAIMKMTGRSVAYASGSGGGAGWTSAGVMDTLDIMQLPLADVEEPTGSGIKSATRDNVTYLPWEGPDTYIPVNMVKVFNPGLLEAGRVARPSLLQRDHGLSIISVTRPADAQLASHLPTNGNGNGNGSKNGKSSSNGSNGSNRSNGSNGKQRSSE